MKPTLVSIMIPSRKRPDGLRTTLESIRETATGDDYEILIRIDEDDSQSMAVKDELSEKFGAIFFTGNRLGYGQLDSGYYAGLEQEANGTWVWIAGDDMTITGDWLGELRKVPIDNYIVQPAISMLNASVYKRAEGQAFPIFPRFCWKPYSSEFPRPFDTKGDKILRDNGWQTWFLEGVTFHHNEALPQELLKHREGK